MKLRVSSFTFFTRLSFVSSTKTTKTPITIAMWLGSVFENVDNLFRVGITVYWLATTVFSALRYSTVSREEAQTVGSAIGRFGGALASDICATWLRDQFLESVLFIHAPQTHEIPTYRSLISSVCCDLPKVGPHQFWSRSGVNCKFQAFSSKILGFPCFRLRSGTGTWDSKTGPYRSVAGKQVLVRELTATGKS